MTPCPDVETLFEGLELGAPSVLDHVKDCAPCSALVEEHRQLEKDLYRLQDPLPPRDFVFGVMARVQVEPIPLGVEVGWGMGILCATLGLGALAFVAGHGRLGAATASVASSFISAKAVTGSLLFAMGTAWHAATVPLGLGMGCLLMAALLGLYKLSPAPSSQIARAS
jgi:hypothetical protein